MKKIKYKSMSEGSFTIEATFIMGVILSVILFIIYTSFYIHDMCVLRAAATEAANRGCNYIVQDVSIEDGTIDWQRRKNKSVLWRFTSSYESEQEEIRKYAACQVDGRMIIAKRIVFTVEAKSDTVVVRYKGGVNLLFAKLFERIGNLAIEDKITMQYVETEELLRMTSATQHGISEDK